MIGLGPVIPAAAGNNTVGAEAWRWRAKAVQRASAGVSERDSGCGSGRRAWRASAGKGGRTARVGINREDRRAGVATRIHARGAIAGDARWLRGRAGEPGRSALEVGLTSAPIRSYTSRLREVQKYFGRRIQLVYSGNKILCPGNASRLLGKQE
jgi:hypothetical protein